MAVIIIIDVLVVAILVGLVLTRGPEWTLPFFVFVMLFFPSESQIPLPGFFALTTQRVALSCFALLYLFFRNGEAGAAPLQKVPLAYLLLAHVGWCVVSTANSVVPVDSLKKMLFEVIEYYLMYCILVRMITQLKTVHRIMGAMVFAVFVACILGTVEAYSDWRVTTLFPYIAGRFAGFSGYSTDDRYHSTFAAPHMFGAAISFAIVEVLYLLTIAKSGARKLYLWLALLIMFLNIYKVVTRGPWLALIIGLGLLVFVGDRVTRSRIVVLVLLSVAVMVVRPGVYDTVRSLYSSTLDTSNPDNIKADSFEYRFALRRVAQAALDKSLDRELWGYGLESFFYLDLTGPFYSNATMHFRSCDSSWLELMVETGYVGLLIIAVLLIKPALLLMRDLRIIPKPQNYLCGILFINMVQYYFMMTNVALYSWGNTAYMLWTWIALAMVYRPLVERENARVEAPIAEADFDRLELADV